MGILTDFILHSTTTELLERDASIARTDRTLERLAAERERLSLEGSVSSSARIEQIESFADRLIRENTAKQAEAERVARNVRRATKLLAEFDVARPPKRFDTSQVVQDDFHPKTVFGTDAFVREAPSWRPVGYVANRVVHAMHLNPRFVTKHIAIPCLERATRREVMFAKGKAGRGYRGPHRRRRFSDIWC